jgi:hypothetical protein
MGNQEKFEKIYQKLQEGARRDILKELSNKELKEFKSYYDEKNMETIKYLIKLLYGMNQKDRFNFMFRLDSRYLRIICKYYIEGMVEYLNELPKEKREETLASLPLEDRKRIKEYMASHGDSEFSSGRSGLNSPKVLRPTPTPSERLERAYTETLMQPANNFREALASQREDRYSEMIEETYRMDREREEMVRKDKENRQGSRRGR